MTELLEQAFAKIQALPADMQDQAARLLLIYAGDQSPTIALSSEEETDLIAAQAEMQRGEYATDEEVDAILAKYRM